MIEALVMEGTQEFPHVVLDARNNRFEITGKSVPDEAELFYRQVLDWLEGYSKSPNSETIFKFNLDYFNIASSKRILFILYKLSEMVQEGHKVLVSWCFDESDADMHEVGKDFAFMVKIPFEFVPYKPEVDGDLSLMI